MAVQKNLTNLVDAILNRPDVIIDNIDDDGFTPLLYACVRGFEENAIKLINKGADVNVINKKYQSPIYSAVFNDNLNLVKHILDNPNFIIPDISMNEDNDDYPLIVAIGNRNEEISIELIKHNFDINIVS